MLKRGLIVIFLVTAFFSFIPLTVQAQESATPKEVYDLILKAVSVLQQLGEEGLAAFNDPKGEFVYKDTYVMVVDCQKMVILAHPNPQLIGLDVSNHQDKNPDAAKRINPSRAACEAGQDSNGGWVEYYWEKLGEDKPSRKITFSLMVPKTPYLVMAGIYNDTVSVKELNSQIK